jgi:GTP-binding protein EngB required for normal cell division
MEQIEPSLQQIKTLAYDQAKYHMMRERLDLETFLTKYELMYKMMVTSGAWAPACNKIDKLNQAKVEKEKKEPKRNKNKEYEDKNFR